MTSDAGFSKGPTWWEARDQVLLPLLRARSVVALISAAEEWGLVDAAREPVSVERLAEVTGQSDDRVRMVCRALVAAGVLTSATGRYCLTTAWQALAADGAPAQLATILLAAEVEANVLRGGPESEDYWSIPARGRQAYAAAYSPNPFSPPVVEQFRAGTMTVPAVRERLAMGGRHLELGSGLAGRMLCMLQAYPRMSAVGVELAPDLAAEARRRADTLGVADRMIIVVGDAATAQVGTGFATAQWSQFFFPESSRTGALHTLHQALTSGGILEAPVFASNEASDRDSVGDDAVDVALARVVHSAWGIPGRTVQALADEVSAAGFTDVRTEVTGGPFVRLTAKRP